MNKKIYGLACIFLLIFYGSKNISGQNNNIPKNEIISKLNAVRELGGDLLGYSDEILSLLEEKKTINRELPPEELLDEIDKFDSQSEAIDPLSALSSWIDLGKARRLETITIPDKKGFKISAASLPSPINDNFKLPVKVKNAIVYASDRSVPAEFYYIRINNSGKLLECLNFLESKLKLFNYLSSGYAVDFLTRKKILKQIAFPDGDLLKELTPTIDEFIITGSDPFIVEGSDISLIIRPSDSKAFSYVLNSFRKKIAENYKIEDKDITLCGINGKILSSDYRKIHSFIFVLPDGTIIISNSKGACETIIETNFGRHPSLGESKDYLYSRTLYPSLKDKEDIFIYVSDLFIRHLVSPVLKIQESRRIKEASRMAILEKYAIYYYQIKNKMPSSIAEIMSVTDDTAINYSRKNELKLIKENPLFAIAQSLPDDTLTSWSGFERELAKKTKSGKKSKRKKGDPGSLSNAMRVFYRNMIGSSPKSPYEVISLIKNCEVKGISNSIKFQGLKIIDGTFRSVSEEYGMRGLMTPCIDIDDMLISENEALEYKEFLSDFQSYFESTLSPMAIRVKFDPDLSIDGFILKNDNNPLFSLLQSISTEGTMQLNPHFTGKDFLAEIAFKANPAVINEYLLLNKIKIDYRELKNELKDIITGEIRIAFGDGENPIVFNPSSLKILLDQQSYGHYESRAGFFIWLALHPVVISIPLKNEKAGKSFTNSLLAELTNKLNSGNLIKAENFRYSTGGDEINILKLTVGNSLNIRIHTMIRDNNLYITTSEKYIAAIKEQKPAQTSMDESNLCLELNLGNKKNIQEYFLKAFIEDGLNRSLKNFGTIKLMTELYPEKNSDELQEVLYNNFGFITTCPLGGKYEKDKKSGEIFNTQFGYYNLPVIKEGSKGFIIDEINNLFKYRNLSSSFSLTSTGITFKFTAKK